MMTEKEAIQKMTDLVDKEKRDGMTILFSKPDIRFKPTRRMEQWEKIANIPRPEVLTDSKYNLAISIKGIAIGPREISWEEIAATGLKTKAVDKNEQTYYYHFLLIGLKNGSIVQVTLGDIDRFYGQFGHFIEEFKLEHSKQTS